MLDFTLTSYKSLLLAFKNAGYDIMPFGQYMQDQPQGKVLILRHDVDKLPYNSVKTALVERSLGIRASYYFRAVKQSNDPDAIRQIVSLGHEIGYHYEDLAITNGNKETAIKHFEEQLKYFRTFYPVNTICMHGVPAKRYDGRDLWLDDEGQRQNKGQYDYRSYGIIGEPYFDVDFSRVFYLTDTGCRWDGFRMSIRDKVKNQDEWIKKGWVYHTTDDIINAVSSSTGPFDDRTVMITTHPQRWTDNRILWLREQIWQRAKNIVKRVVICIGGL